MTKRDFELVAGVVADLEDEHLKAGNGSYVRGYVAGRLADALAKSNERFNREVFVAACLSADEGTEVGAKVARVAEKLRGS
jgi:hypothetical protein